MAAAHDSNIPDPSSPISERPIHSKISEVLDVSHLSLQYLDAFNKRISGQLTSPLSGNVSSAFRKFRLIVSESSQAAKKSLEALTETLGALIEGFCADEISTPRLGSEFDDPVTLEAHNAFRELRFSLHLSIRSMAFEPTNAEQDSEVVVTRGHALNTLLKLLEATLGFSDWWKHRRIEENQLHALIQRHDSKARDACISLVEEFEIYIQQIKEYQMDDPLVNPQPFQPTPLHHPLSTEVAPRERMDEAILIMSKITTATQKTFERIKAFHEHFSISTQKDKPENLRLAHDFIVAQSHAYADAISKSIGAAEEGSKIALTAISVLEEDLEANRTALIASMYISVSVAHRKASETEGAFRDIRKELFDMYSSLGGSYRSSIELGGPPTQVPETNVELHFSFSSDLLRDTLRVLDDLVDAVGRFVDWWAMIAVENSRLSVILGIGCFATKSLWQSLEKQYTAYFTEIKRQQGYYAIVANGLKKSPKSRTGLLALFLAPFKFSARKSR